MPKGSGGPIRPQSNDTMHMGPVGGGNWAPVPKPATEPGRHSSGEP